MVVAGEATREGVSASATRGGSAAKAAIAAAILWTLGTDIAEPFRLEIIISDLTILAIETGALRGREAPQDVPLC
jgi:hypothetical protein